MYIDISKVTLCMNVIMFSCETCSHLNRLQQYPRPQLTIICQELHQPTSRGSPECVCTPRHTNRLLLVIKLVCLPM